MTSILQLPTEKNGGSIPQFSSVRKTMYLRWTDCLFWFKLPVEIEGKKLVYCFFIFLPFLLDCFWEDVVPIVPGTRQFLQVNSVLNRHRCDESNRVPYLGQQGETLSLREIFFLSQNVFRANVSSCLSQL